MGHRASPDRTPPTSKRRRTSRPLSTCSDTSDEREELATVAPSSLGYISPAGLVTPIYTKSKKPQSPPTPARVSKEASKRDRRKARLPRHIVDERDAVVRSCCDRGDVCVASCPEWSRSCQAAPQCGDDWAGGKLPPLGSCTAAERGAWMKSMKLRASSSFAPAVDNVMPQHHPATPPLPRTSSPPASAFIRIPFAQHAAPLRRDWVHSHCTPGAPDAALDDGAPSRKDARGAERPPGSAGPPWTFPPGWLHSRAGRIVRRRHSISRAPSTGSGGGSTGNNSTLPGGGLESWTTLLPLFNTENSTFESFTGDEPWEGGTERFVPRAAVSHARRRGLSRELMAGVSLGFPASLLFDDRDFTANDYEMLCRLDCAVDSRKAATAAEIEAMGGTAQYRDLSTVLRAGMPRCVICLEWFRAADDIRKLSCQHVYHQSCIDQWLGTKASCPVCQHWCKP